MEKSDYVIDTHGAFVGKTSERLVLKKKGNQLDEQPLRLLRAILVSARGVSFSSSLVECCSEFQIPIEFLDYRRRAVARLSVPHPHKTVGTMRGQFDARFSSKGATVAKTMIREKLKSQKRLLNYHRRRAGTQQQALENREVIRCAIDAIDRRGGDVEEMRASWMGIEGAASRAYWQTMAQTIGESAEFRGREHRGAEDLVNRMLNYGYAILQSRVWGMIERAGLHPFAGFLHEDRAGRPSLVLDLMEPWRIIVDDTVFSVVRQSGSRLPVDGLPDHFKYGVVDGVTDRLAVPGQYGQKQLPVRECMMEAIRNIGVYLRGDGALKPYRWNVRGPKEPRDN